MGTKWTESEWTKGRFFLLASLITTSQALGYLDLLPGIVKVVLLADVYALLAAIAYQEWRSRPYQLVGSGLMLATVVFLVPSGWIPAAPSALAASGIQGWGQLLFLPAGMLISVGALLYAWWLLTDRPPNAAPRRAARVRPSRLALPRYSGVNRPIPAGVPY